MVFARSPLLLALLAAVLLLATTADGRVPGVNSDETVEMRTPGELQGPRTNNKSKMAALLSRLETRKRSETEAEPTGAYPATSLKFTRKAAGPKENKAGYGEPLKSTYFENASKTNNSKVWSAGAPSPLENFGVNGDLFEGDIMLPKDQQGRNMIINPTELWPRGEVPCVIASGFTTSERAIIASAAREFERHTCIRVRPLASTDDASQGYVRIIKGTGCYSSVGRQVGSSGQELSLGDGCLHSGIVVHELMHVIGFWHEQSRPDRDQYVRIHFDNIQAGKEHNFRKYTTSEVQLKSTPYDIGSIMHYRSNAFARDPNRPTISALQQTSATMGQRDGLSATDIIKIKKLYGCTSCIDNNVSCPYWAGIGECTKNPLYMHVYCAKSCNICRSEACPDMNQNCAAWAATGECSANPGYMLVYCKYSCAQCGCNNLNDSCQGWADRGECQINPGYMHVYCRKACRLC